MPLREFSWLQRDAGLHALRRIDQSRYFLTGFETLIMPMMFPHDPRQLLPKVAEQ